jgi:glutamate--cysteine ligase
MSHTEEPITDIAQLVAYLAAGATPQEDWRIGTEHEKFAFHRADLSPVLYEGDHGIGVLLENLALRFGWDPILESGRAIGLRKGAASISLEPGGQIELSGAPLSTIHETHQEIEEHLRQLAEVCREFEIAFLGIGAQPKWPFTEIPWMPKGRYRRMRTYLPTKGRLSLDMMTRTATVQANLDFADEDDMVLKFRVGLALQPVVTALFANSPFIDGQPNGYLSYRNEIWRHTDPDRCGWLPFVFEPGFGFARYVEYALDVPMLFLYQDGQYWDIQGTPFRAFLAGRLPGLADTRPTLADWELHLSTLFPDVRLKQFLEMRGADAGNTQTLCALPAFWKGILYDKDSLNAAWERIGSWTLKERAAIHRQVSWLGLDTPLPGGGTLSDLARQTLEWSRAGLHRQNQTNANGCDESIYLHSLFEVQESGRTPAHRLLEAYHGSWERHIDPIFQEARFESFLAECQPLTQ